MDLRAIIEGLEAIGFYNVILPFLLVYVVVFAILEKSNIFSGGSAQEDQVRKVNAIVAFVFALFVVASLQTVRFIESLIINVVLVIIFILLVLILLGFIFGEDYKKLIRDSNDNLKPGVAYSIAGVVFLVALYILFEVLGVWTRIFDWWDSLEGDGTFSTVVIILFIAGILYLVTKSDGKNNE